MADTRTLEIILRARDEASQTVKGVAKSTDSLSESFKRNFKEAGAFAGGVLGSLGLLTSAAVNNAASYEQVRISFESMLGSADRAQKLLKEVSDFAQETPFELPQVAEGAKRLLAYNIEAKKIIPTFKMLGDIAAGVGTDKLPQLITAFGQVQAKGRLMGQELLQFTEAGVGLGQQLQKQFGVTREELEKMISSSDVTAEQVTKALQSMTSQGGLFFDGMNRQSKTFNGIMSNISDNFGKFVREVVGISDRGEIRQGSLFAFLKVAAERFLVVLDEVRPKVTRFVNELSQNKNVLLGVAGALGGLVVLALGALVVAMGPALLLMTLFAAAGTAIALAITNMNSVLSVVIPYLVTLGTAITGVSLATNGLTGSVRLLFALFAAHPVGLVVTAVAALAAGAIYLATQTDALKTKQDLLTQSLDRLKGSTDGVKNAQERLKDVYLRLEGSEIALERAQSNLNQTVKTYGQNSLEVKEAQHQFNQAQREAQKATNDAKTAITEADKAYSTYKTNAKEYKAVVDSQETSWGRLTATIGSAISRLSEWNDKSMRYGVGFGQLRLPAYANGTNFAPGGWAVVGERGPEIVNLPRGSQVVPSGPTEQMLNRSSNITVGPVYVQNAADVDTMAQRLGFYLQTAGNL